MNLVTSTLIEKSVSRGKVDKYVVIVTYHMEDHASTQKGPTRSEEKQRLSCA